MKKSCPGFTIIELLVAISIIGILSTIGLAKYSEFNRRQILIQAAQELKSNLRLAQDKALAGEKDCSISKCGGTIDGCGNDTDEKPLDGWYVNFSSNNYQIYGSCGGVSFGEKSFNLPSNVSFSPIPSSIRFKPLAQGVEGATTITLSGPTGTEEVTVTKTGEIK